MMGDLADLNAGLYGPMDNPPPPYPRESLPLWARQADVMPQTPEPMSGMWPAYAPPKELPDVGQPAISAGSSRISEGAPWANRVADVMGGLAQSVAPQDPLDWGLMVGGGPIARGAGALIGGVLNPTPAEGGVKGISHGISGITLRDTVANLAKLNRTIPTKDIYEKTIQPHDIPEGSWLTPLIGDRSISGQLITHVGGKELENPVWAQGGYQFMPEWQKQQIGWASDPGPSTKLANRISGLAAQDTPGVYGVYTAMGPQSIDASHHVSDTLSQMMKLEKPNISKTAAEQFDAKMTAINPDFPGVKSSKLQPYLRQQTMDFRNFFAKTMDQRAAQEAGFPDVAQARIAATHPELMDLPSYSGGQAMAKMTGDVIHGSQGFGLAPHYTYRSKLPGEYVGGLAAPLPKDILWPDLAAKIATRIPSAEARIWMAGPLPQRVTPQWQDTAAEWLRRNRMGDVARQ